MHVAVQIAAEAVDEGHGAEAGAGHGAGTAPAERRLDRPQEHAEQAAGDFGLLAQVVPSDALGDRQHPLAERDPGQDLVDQVGGGLDHAARRARGTDIAALATEGDQEVVAAAGAVDAGEPVGQDAALQIR